MNSEQIKQFSKMKKLIMQGKRRFINRKDRDYLQELLKIGITEQQAWNEIVSLNSKDYVIDLRPTYLKCGDALIFKHKINDYMVYIKIKLEEYNEVVCLSFHIDGE